MITTRQTHFPAYTKYFHILNDSVYRWERARGFPQATLSFYSLVLLSQLYTIVTRASRSSLIFDFRLPIITVLLPVRNHDSIVEILMRMPWLCRIIYYVWNSSVFCVVVEEWVFAHSAAHTSSTRTLEQTAPTAATSTLRYTSAVDMPRAHALTVETAKALLSDLDNYSQLPHVGAGPLRLDTREYSQMQKGPLQDRLKHHGAIILRTSARRKGGGDRASGLQPPRLGQDSEMTLIGRWPLYTIHSTLFLFFLDRKYCWDVGNFGYAKCKINWRGKIDVWYKAAEKKNGMVGTGMTDDEYKGYDSDDLIDEI